MSHRQHFSPETKTSNVDMVAAALISFAVILVTMGTVVTLTHGYFGYNKSIALGLFISVLGLIYIFESNKGGKKNLCNK